VIWPKQVKAPDGSGSALVEAQLFQPRQPPNVVERIELGRVTPTGERAGFCRGKLELDSADEARLLIVQPDQMFEVFPCFARALQTAELAVRCDAPEETRTSVDDPCACQLRIGEQGSGWIGDSSFGPLAIGLEPREPVTPDHRERQQRGQQRKRPARVENDSASNVFSCCVGRGTRLTEGAPEDAGTANRVR
jgi:hypothetical protein